MYVFEVKLQDGNWTLTGSGVINNTHVEPTKDRIEAYVEGFMSLRSGKVCFYRDDGSIEREAIYEPHNFDMWRMAGH